MKATKALANTRWSRQRLRRLLYRGFFALLVYLSRVVAPPTRRCGSAFPLGRLLYQTYTRGEEVGNNQATQSNAPPDLGGVIIIQMLLFGGWAGNNVPGVIDALKQLTGGRSWLLPASGLCFAGGFLIGILIFHLVFRNNKRLSLLALVLSLAFPALIIVLLTVGRYVVQSDYARQLSDLLSELALGGGFLGQPVGLYLRSRRERLLHSSSAS